jgi:hypothetical protein
MSKPKQSKFVMPKSIDYDALMNATKARVPGGGFGAPRTMAGGSPKKSLKVKTPNMNTIKQMTRQEKIELLNQLNNISSPTNVKSKSKLAGTTAKKNRTSSTGSDLSKFTTPNRGDKSGKNRPMSASVPKIQPLKFNAPAPAEEEVPGPKQEPLSLVSLVHLKDQLSSSQVIEYLKHLVTTQAKVNGICDDIGTIFDKIQKWKQSFGDLDQQEKAVSKALNNKKNKVQIHNVKTLTAKLNELKSEIGLSEEELTIIIYTSLDHDYLTNLIVLAGEFLMWFNLNFEGESREELDFRENKCEIWLSTC